MKTLVAFLVLACAVPLVYRPSTTAEFAATERAWRAMGRTDAPPPLRITERGDCYGGKGISTSMGCSAGLGYRERVTLVRQPGTDLVTAGLAHELAHAARNGDPSHGPEFRRLEMLAADAIGKELP